MTEEQILLHTFRDNEEMTVDGQSLQGLLRYKNKLEAQVTKLEKRVSILQHSNNLLQTEVELDKLEKPLKAELGSIYDEKG